VAEGTPQSSKELVASVICHELSHQWFGNLVTMKWWDDLWLNESFANMMEYVAVDALEPSWKIWQHFASHETAAALNRDHIAGVQPVKTPVHHPDEITTLFDPAIVYAKGSRLLRMLQTYVGDSSFRKGLHHYFKTHAYSNTSSDDLWRSLNTQTDKDIAGFMTPWLSQSGFPLVSVHATEHGYKLTQERLLIGGHDETQLWPVPLASTNKDFPEILHTKHSLFKAKHSLSLLNKDNNAHFIAWYDTESLQAIIEALDNGKLSSVDRLALLFESVILMKCGRNKPEDVLRLLQHYGRESEESVWTVIAFAIGELHRYVELTDYQPLLETFARELALPLYTQLGAPAETEDSEATKKLRTILYQIMLYSNHEETIEVLLEIARQHDLASVQGELRNVVYSAVAQYGNRTEFAALVSLHNTVSDPQIRQDALGALTSTKDKDHVAILLHQLTNKNHVKPQDMLRWYIGLMRNSDARNDTWEWMTRNWKHIKTTFAGDKMYESFPRYTAAAMNSRGDYTSYREFFDPQMSDPALTRIIEIGRHELDFRSLLIEKQTPSFIEQLQQVAASTRQK
jgi:aminopeptidase N